MIELVGERKYQTKVFKQNLGAPNNIGEFHIGHIHYIPVGETEFQDVDFIYTEYANRWELTKASYNLTIYKRFNGPRLIEWYNYFEGANHTVRFEPYALVWVDMTDPLNESSWQVIGMAQNVQGVEVDDKIIYSGAFGTDLDFIIQKRRSGMKKLVRINNIDALGNQPSLNHEVVALFKYTGPGLKIRANGASQDWDELTYYEGMDGFKISEIADDSKQSFILPSFAYGSPQVEDDDFLQRQSIKVFWAYRQNALWQAKVIPYDFLSSPKTKFPVLADTQSTFYANAGGDGTCAIDDVATWAAARDGAGQYHGDTSTNGSLTKVRRKNASSWYVWRSLFPYPTGDTIGASDPINSATFSLKGDGTASAQTLPTDAGVNVVRGNQADPTDLVDGDFDAVDDNPPSSPMSQELCDSRILVASWNINAYNDFAFNTYGKNFIANTGRGTGNYTKLAICGGYDIDDTESGSNGYDIVYGYFADQTGTDDDPKLVVDYGAGPIPKNVSDSGSGSDAVSVKVLTTISDVGSGSDTPSLKALLSLADTGSGADLLSILAKLAISDVGSGADTIGIKNLISILDSGSGADVLSILRKIAILDSSLGTDAIALIKAILTIADSGLGTDAVSVNTGATQKQVADAGTGTDALSILAKLSILDSGSALDTAGIKALLSLSDAGSGVDTVTIKQFKSISDSGLATEILAIKNALSVVDSGLGVDAFSLLVKVAVQDSGLASELVSVVTGVVFPILYQVEPRDRIFNVKARERMFRVEPRERTPDTGKRGN